jgi:energy-coupling factor transport system ATP-binding protein
VENALRICGITRFKEWPISALSYGEKKRVTIASILVLEPSILIVDEPTAGQDYKHYSEIMEFLKELNVSHQYTILMITHDMHLMLEYATRAIVLADGNCIADTTPSEILTSSSITAAASLKETSLFHLANRIQVDPLHLVQVFLEYERKQRYATV